MSPSLNHFLLPHAIIPILSFTTTLTRSHNFPLPHLHRLWHQSLALNPSPFRDLILYFATTPGLPILFLCHLSHALFFFVLFSTFFFIPQFLVSSFLLNIFLSSFSFHSSPYLHPAPSLVHLQSIH